MGTAEWTMDEWTDFRSWWEDWSKDDDNDNRIFGDWTKARWHTKAYRTMFSKDPSPKLSIDRELLTDEMGIRVSDSSGVFSRKSVDVTYRFKDGTFRSLQYHARGGYGDFKSTTDEGIQQSMDHSLIVIDFPPGDAAADLNYWLAYREAQRVTRMHLLESIVDIVRQYLRLVRRDRADSDE